MRAFKKFVYGIFYLAIFGGIAFFVYSGWFRSAPSCFNGMKDPGENGVDCGGVCTKTCPPADSSGIQVGGQVHLFHPDASTVTAVVPVNNSNQDLAARKFSYKFVFYGAGGKELAGMNCDTYDSSFIYASEIKYITKFCSYQKSSDVASADFSVVGDPVWVSKDIFPKPQLGLQNSTTSLSGDSIRASGTVINNSNGPVSNVTVMAIFYNSLGQEAGVSKTELQELSPGGQKQFYIDHPKLGNIDFSATKIYLYGE